MIRILDKIYKLYRLFITKIIYSKLFDSVGQNTIVFTPLKLVNLKNISIGSNATIEKNITLYSVAKYNQKNYDGKIFIGDNVYINNNCNITSANEIFIDENVVMAFNVSLFDFNHDFENVDIPVKYSDLIVLGKIKISKNCWIGMNVAIIGNIKLGENCIVGANSVVTKSFPSHCVIAGNPARIIKRYDFNDKTWKKVNKEGVLYNEI